MGNYFYTGPQDIGDGGAKGIASLGQSIGAGLSTIGQMRQDEKMLKLKASIADQQQKADMERQITGSAAQYGVQPVMGSDGKVDIFATAAATTQKKALFDRVQSQLGLTDQLQTRDAYDLNSKAKQYGIDPSKAATNKGPAAMLPSVQGASGMPVDQPLERQVFQAEQKAKLDEVSAEAAARAKATAPFSQPYSRAGGYQKDGQYVGDKVFDQRTGQSGLMGPNGSLAPLPDGAEPMSPGGLQKTIPDIDHFRKLKQDVTTDEIALNNFNRYSDSVGGANVGLQRMADDFAGKIRTLAGNKQLTQEQLASAMAKGELQGLIGANRIAVGGPGVMTEQDAGRVIARVGGDVGALQNPQVVKQALSELYQDRYRQYQDNVKFYNSAVQDMYGSRGFDRATPVQFNDKFGAPAAGAQPQGQPAQQPFQVLSVKRIN